jgi:hypothetical protein
VNNSPNDPGEWEEWMVLYMVGPLLAFFEVEVKDNIGKGVDAQFPGEEYHINKKLCLPRVFRTFKTLVLGYEEDLWPNPDDSIPVARIKTYNRCEVNENEVPEDTVRTPTHQFCDWNYDLDRYACYWFRAHYR